MTHHPTPASHFNKGTLRILANHKIFVVGMQALPDEAGSFLNATTGYLLNDNGTGRLRTYFEVLDIATSF